MTGTIELPAGRYALAGLDELRSYAVEVGGDRRLVQGAGGNFSVKSGEVLWIKASGTRLSEALDREVFVPMRLAETRAAVLDTENLAPFIDAERAEAGLRPSIETSLHALLPHRVVLHVHSTGAIAAGLGEGLADALAALPDWFACTVVPYAKPGVRLARAVFDRVGRDVGDAPLALLLVNHGLVVAADDVATARRIVEAVQGSCAEGPPPVDAAAASGTTAEGGWTLLHPAGTVSEYQAALLRLGPLTPDQAVFMGPAPFTTRAEPDGAAIAAIDADGSVWLRSSAGADEAEITTSAVDVVRLLRGASITPLDRREVNELVNWEAEQWRRQQKR